MDQRWETRCKSYRLMEVDGELGRVCLKLGVEKGRELGIEIRLVI